MITETDRDREIGKYRRAYQTPGYAMGGKRKIDAVKGLREIPCRGSFLDVGCGRGEMLAVAQELGFAAVRGTEVVEGLVNISKGVYWGRADRLPFGRGAFEVVTMFDVIEHLLPADSEVTGGTFTSQGDDELACKELARVASKHVILTANNKPSFNADGEDLHINRRNYDDWDALFRAWFPTGSQITQATDLSYVSQPWRIDLP